MVDIKFFDGAIIIYLKPNAVHEVDVGKLVLCEYAVV